MPNPVAANDLQPISGSLQTSRVSYGVETAGKNYGQNYNSTTWYSDIPNNGQFYTIISDNYTANYYNSRSLAEGAYVEGGLPAVDEYSAPVFWVTPGTSSLDIVTIVNGLPDRVGQTPFNSGSQALNWIASSSNYFAVGPDYYEQIDADRLGLYLDANQVISYPTTQSTWYDLSGQSQNFTLYNGVKWQNDGWFEFDLTDDYMLNTTVPYQSSSGTIVVTCSPNSGLNDDYIAGVGGNLTIGGSRAIGIINNRWWFVGYGSTNEDYQSGIPVNYDRWSHVAYTWNNTTEITASANGVFEKVIRTGLVTPNGVNFTLGRPPWNTAANTWGGFLSKVQFYPKALTEAEMRQNYYGGPIVTGSISGLYNAGNLVSFAPGTTTTFNMAANVISGSLQNGVAYKPDFGGYWSFDGADDRILLEGSTQNAWILNSGDTWTVTAWIRVPNGSSTSSGLDYQGILSNTSGGPIYSVFHIVNTVIAYSHYNGAWLTEIGSTPVNDGKWHMLTWVNESNNITFYTDNIPNGTFNSTISGVGWLDVIGSSLGRAFLGDIASLQINQGKAFTASEVLQQYNATK